MAHYAQLVIVIACLSASVLVASALIDDTRIRERRSTLTEDAEEILKQASSVNVNDVGQLISLVEKNRAEDCLARVICELSNNSQSHGDSGSKFAQSLLKFRQSKHPKVKFYIDAMSLGAKSKSAKDCRTNYLKCNHQTSEVVTVGNRLLRSN